MNISDTTEAVLIAVQTPAPKGFTGIPILLWGKPGQGKSSFLENLHCDNFPVQTLIASIHDPTDFSGLPMLQNDKVCYAVPEWVENFGPHGQGILFLDELTTAPPSVQSALLRIVLERKAGIHPLPEGVRIVSAANPPDQISGGWELTPPLLNRFVHLDWHISTEDYIRGLEHGFAKPRLPEISKERHAAALPGWKAKVRQFLKIQPDLLNTNPDEAGRAFASPRTWDYAISLMASCELLGKAPGKNQPASGVFHKLMEGAIGRKAAIPFISYLKKLNLPDPDALLLGKESVNLRTLNDSDLFILFKMLEGNISKFFKRSDFGIIALNYLNLAQRVFTQDRKDIIYPSLKQVVSTKMLLEALIQARLKDSQTFNKIYMVMQSLFTDSSLLEMVKILEKWKQENQ